MAISVSNLTSGNDVDGNSTCTTASITLPANTLTLATISSRTAANDPNHATISGWTEVLSVNYDNAGSQKRLTVLRRLAGSDSTGTLTIDFAAQNQTDVAWVIDKVVGADITGTNGANAIVQTASNTDLSGTATTLTATLGAFSFAQNATYGAIAVGNKPVTITPGTGFTKIADGEAATNGVHVTSEFKYTNDTTVDFTTSLAGELAVIAIEIKSSFPSAWSTMAQIKADNTKVSGASDLTNFPALIKDGNIPASIYSAMQATGADLRITTDSAGTTEIPFEIVSITPGSSLAEVWAKIPTLATATDTSIYLWAGNANAVAYATTDPFGSQNVWTDYALVTHLEGSSANKTATSQTLTDTAITYNTTNGKIYQGAGFNGTSSKIVVTDAASLEIANGDISFWFKPTSTLQATMGAIYYLFDKGNTYIGCEVSVNGTMRFRIYDGSAHDCTTTQAVWTGGTYYYVSLKWGSGGQKIVINGTTDGTNAGTGSFTNTADNWTFMVNGTTFSNGNLDEIRYRSSIASVDWSATEYANQNSPSTFWSEVKGGHLLGLLGIGM